MSRFRYDLFERNMRPDDEGAMYALATLATIAYTNDESLLDEWARWMGHYEDDNGNPIINFQPKIGRWKRNYDPIVAIISDRRGCVVAISGTDSFEQAVKYMLGSFTYPRLAYLLQRVHCNFSYLAQEIKHLLLLELPGSLEDNTPITFVGHSMGAAIAYLLAVDMHFNSRFRVAQCLGISTPKVGGTGFTELALPVAKTFVRNFQDPIPALPPAVGTSSNRLVNGIADQLMFRYDEVGPQFVLDEFGDWEYRYERDEDSFWYVLRTTLAQTPIVHDGNIPTPWQTWAGDVPLLHSTYTYLSRLQNVLQRRGHPRNIEPLNRINQTIRGNSLLFNNGLPVPATGLSRNLLAFSDPSNPPPDDPDQIPVDPADPVRIDRALMSVEVISSSGNLGDRGGNVVRQLPPVPIPGLQQALFSNQPRRNWVFKGYDRRLLEKLRDVAKAIDARDNELAASSASARTARQPIIPRDADQPLLAWIRLIEKVEYLLSLYVE